MTDIVPELIENIMRSFEARIEADERVQKFIEGVEDPREAARCTERIGRHAAAAYLEFVKEEAMPNGKLYWNIVERTMAPLIKRAYELVNGSALKMQQAVDEKKGIRIKPVSAKFPDARTTGLMDKIVNMFEDESDERDV